MNNRKFSHLDDLDSFELENWPFYWLIRVNASYLQKNEKALKKVGLDVPRWRVLMLLDGRSARSVSYLAKEAVSKLPTMTKIVKRMQADGLVECRPRATDARVTEVQLTKLGASERKKAWAATKEIYRDTFSDLSDERIIELIASLKQIMENLTKDR